MAAFQEPVVANTNNMIDAAGNQINAGAKSTFSTISTTNHNFIGSVTPNLVNMNQQTGTATATAIGTITTTQYTPTGGVSGTYVCETKLI